MIRRANLHDLDRIEAIYNEIHSEIEAGRMPIRWTRGIYPARDIAEDSIRRREMFVLEFEGEIVASARINQYQGPEYDHATWRFAADPDSVMVLHTLCVSPKYKGRGFGKAFVAFYESFARSCGCTTLRLDSDAINRPAIALYLHLGYQKACVVNTSFNGIDAMQLVCMDKKIDLSDSDF